MKKLLTCLSMILVSAGAMAETRPFNLSLTPDVAVYSRTDTVEGVTLSVWGENQQRSFALGLVNGMKMDSVGLAWGIVNYADNYKGVQWAAVNYSKQDDLGWFSSAVNFTQEKMTGLQTGFVNYAGFLKGVQFGFINYSDDGKAGVQIGLINVMPKNKWFDGMPNELAPGMIIVNWRF